MLNEINIKGAWTHKDSTFKFEKGHTLITGRNGKGKSLITEMVQFALWGIKALRGKSDGYKGVSVTLWFDLKNKQYKLTRSTTKALLEENGVPVATGTKPVNAAVRNLFGYSYEVFQVSNAANQGSINRLGDMLPTARKQMVDETIGLNVIDGLESHIADNLKGVRARLDAAREGLIAPVRPTRPEDYTEAGLAREALAMLLKDLETVAVLNSQALEKAPEIPSWSPMGQEEHLDAFLEHEEKYKVDMTERKNSEVQLKNLPAPAPEVRLHDADASLDSFLELQEQARNHWGRIKTLRGLTEGQPRRAPYTPEELNGFEKTLDLIDAWGKKRKLQEEAEKHKLECPNCHHEWVVPNPLIEQLYGDIPDQLPADLAAPMSRKDIKAERDMIERVKRNAEFFQELDELEARKDVQTVESFNQLIKEINDQRMGVKLYEAGKAVEDLRERLTERLAQPPMVSLAATIKAVQESLAARQRMSDATNKASEVAMRVSLVKQALERFPTNLREIYDQAAMVQIVSSRYDTEAKRYAEDLQAYETKLDLVAQLEGDEADWTNARVAMAAARAEVKSYLLPSLNTVASRLVAEMTGNELVEIIVDEDFDISVIEVSDGVYAAKPLETLSGAGKAVANLALRLGLGQVLTNRTFPVVLLDEIDASCDDTRAEQISQAVSRLSKQMSQVIVISHKPNVVSEHRIEL